MTTTESGMKLQPLLIGLLSLTCTPLLVASPADSQKGRVAFVRCMACHGVKAGEPHKLGPNLHGVVGSRAAAAEGFAYSDALRTANITWDEDTLRRWIVNPGAVAPGNSMAYVNTLSAADIDALIAYLKSVSAGP
ncbi:MAG: cytochrome c family protein [Steroidobacteraceae bacterium]